MVAAVLLGLAIGLAVGTLGGGGSVLAVPVLVYVLDQSVADATTASLAVVAGGAIAGAIGHATAGRVCWRHAGSFTASAIPGIVLGTLAGEELSRSATLLIFAAVMLPAALAIWRKGDEDEEAGGWQPGTAACPPLRLPQDLFAGAAVGFLTGLLGVGGGFLIVPTLAVALAFTMRTAVGTSLAIITATSVLGLVVHLAAGRGLDVEITAAMTLGCAVGAAAGAAVASKMPQPALARGFALLVAAVAATLVVSVAV